MSCVQFSGSNNSTLGFNMTPTLLLFIILPYLYVKKMYALEGLWVRGRWAGKGIIRAKLLTQLLYERTEKLEGSNLGWKLLSPEDGNPNSKEL